MTHRRTVYELPDHPSVILQDMDIIVETFRYLDTLAIKERVASPGAPKLEFLRMRSRTLGMGPTLCAVAYYRMPRGVIRMSYGSRHAMRLTYTPNDLLDTDFHLRDWREKEWTVSEFTDGVYVACKAAFSAFYLGLEDRWREPTGADLPRPYREAA